MADAARLTIVADMQDRAKNALKGLRSEVDANTRSLERAKKASADDADVESILFRAKQRKLDALGEENRKRVQSARQERVATAEGAGAFDKLKGSVEGVSRAGEFVNKVLGGAGFLGIAAGVIGLIGELISRNSTYGRVLKEVQEQQGRWNELLEDFGKRERDVQLASMSNMERILALLREQTEAEQDKHAEASKMLDANQALLNLNKQQQAALQHWTGNAQQRLLVQQQIDVLQQEENRLVNDIAKGTAAIRGHAAAVKAELAAQTPEYQAHKKALEDMLAVVAKYSNPSKTMLEGIDEVMRRHNEGVQKAEAERERQKKAGEAAAKAAAERLRGLDDEIGKLRFAGRVEEDGERERFARRLLRQKVEEDFARRRIGATERDRQLEKLALEAQAQANQERKEAVALEQERRTAELDLGDRLAGLRAELAISQARTEAERQQLELRGRLAQIERDRSRGRVGDDEADLQRQMVIESERRRGEEKTIEDRAKWIDTLGASAARADKPLAMLDERLASLGTTIRDTASIWSSYARGQTALGDAISGTIGVIGQQVAQAISDRRAQALVEGGFETAASIASFASGNVPAGIGHAAAAASFFALAGKGGGKSAGSSGASAPAQSNVVQGNFGGGGRSTSRGEWQPTQVVHHYGQGIVYGLGQDVARTQESTRDQLRYTGHRGRGL